MADGHARTNSANEGAHISSTADADEGDLKQLRDAIGGLPPEPVEDLLYNGVCARCIFRLFGLHKLICSCPSVTTSVLSAFLRELIDHNSSGENVNVRNPETTPRLKEEIDFCSICLGILQFVHHDDRRMSVKKDCSGDLAASIADVVKKDGHQIDSFSLEVSVPQTVIENDQAVWLYVKKKYGTEPWFPEKFPSESIATKDFLKLSVTSPLETLLDVRSNLSDFRIRLTYTLFDMSAKDQHINERNGCNKRRKTGDSNILKKCDSEHKVEGQGLINNSSDETKDHRIGFVKFPLEKVNQCCSLIFQGYRTSIYIGGRYLKYSRNVSQSRWIVDDERMGEASIEEIVGSNILPMCQGDSYKFHAAGREDIDVRMLGTGRPFLVEIQNARQVPSEVLIKHMEAKINSMERKFVRVKNLKALGSQGWDLMREGEAEKQKQYAALVWISRPLTNDDVLTISSLKDMKILQNTPIRVLHRRSPIEREKVIHWMKLERIAGSSQYFLLHLCTQAGTYIKEFVHGDLGRTHPSVGSVLGCRAEILQLDVTDVKMDCFQA